MQVGVDCIRAALFVSCEASLGIQGMAMMLSSQLPTSHHQTMVSAGTSRQRSAA